MCERNGTPFYAAVSVSARRSVRIGGATHIMCARMPRVVCCVFQRATTWSALRSLFVCAGERDIINLICMFRSRKRVIAHSVFTNTFGTYTPKKQSHTGHSRVRDSALFTPNTFNACTITSTPTPSALFKRACCRSRRHWCPVRCMDFASTIHGACGTRVGLP